MSEPVFTAARLDRVRAAADRALPFLEQMDDPLGAAWVRHRWKDGPSGDVLAELAAYQQPDGGFAGLEVDIEAPVSTAFDGHLAMHVLLGLRDRLQSELVDRLGGWYARNQHEDGDWHFSPEAYEHRLAPWFASWEFPGLNPACCVAGLTHALGIATPEMLVRVERLWREKATIDQARSGDFYTMLPIIEYVAHIDVEDREVWLHAIADGVERGIADSAFGDAEHALDHLAGSGPEVIARLDRDDVVTVIDAVLADQREDGGWPTPYDPAWRPWFTASTLVLLARLHHTIA
ncbi:MAG TPA: hypothetical protein VGR22_01440 [Thermomicrobiales bacterium]|nr:hypothetical protein [Thermomicrobiales bacterium]